MEVYSDRIEYSVNAKWFQSKDKITFSTICSTGHQFFRFPHFMIAAWLCFIYGVLTLIPLFQSDDDVATMLIVTGVGLIFAGLIFFWLYFKVQRFIIYVYTNCGKGMLFAFQPRKSFILAPQDAIDTTLEDVDSIMEILSSLIESNKASRIAAPCSSNSDPQSGSAALNGQTIEAPNTIQSNVGSTKPKFVASDLIMAFIVLLVIVIVIIVAYAKKA